MASIRSPWIVNRQTCDSQCPSATRARCVFGGFRLVLFGLLGVLGCGSPPGEQPTWRSVDTPSRKTAERPRQRAPAVTRPTSRSQEPTAGAASRPPLEAAKPPPKPGSWEYAQRNLKLIDFENFIRANPKDARVAEARKKILTMAPAASADWQSFREALARLDDVDGAYFDPDTGQLLICGDECDAASPSMPPLLLDDFAVAL